MNSNEGFENKRGTVGARGDSLEHTQPMPRISPDMVTQETQLLNTRQVRERVRELEPVAIPGRGAHNQARANVNIGENPGYPGGNQRPQKEKQSRSMVKSFAMLLVVFFVAAFTGAMLSGYMGEKQRQDDERQQQMTQASHELQQADREQASLQQKKAQLEKQYQELLAKQKEAQSAADKLAGQKEQLDKNQKEKSTAGKLLDKVTGEEGKQKQESESVGKQAADAVQAVENINQSVKNASAAIDEINSQLDQLEAMRQKAKSVKASVDAAYSENQGTIDKMLYYAAQGFNGLKGLFGN